MRTPMELQVFREMAKGKTFRINRTLGLTINKSNYRSKLAKRLKEEKFLLIDDICEKMDRISGADNYDIQFKFEWKLELMDNQYGIHDVEEFEEDDIPTLFEIFTLKVVGFEIIIPYPEFTIRNERDQSMLIKDMFVYLPFNFKACFHLHGEDTYKLEMDRMHGIRGSLSVQEFASGYLHSHLQSRTINNNELYKKQRFCTGTDFFEAGRMDFNHHPESEELLEMYIFSISTYLQWESISGAPHICMETVVQKDTCNLEIFEEVLERTYKEVVKMMQQGKVSLNVDWMFKEGKYCIIDNQKLEAFFISTESHFSASQQNLSLLNHGRGNSYTALFQHKDAKGNYYTEGKNMGNGINNPSRFTPLNENNWFPYRGQKVYLTIYGEAVRKATPIKYIHPKVKDYVRQQFELQANRAYLRKSAIDRVTKNSSNTRDTKQNKVSVSKD